MESKGHRDHRYVGGLKKEEQKSNKRNSRGKGGGSTPRRGKRKGLTTVVHKTVVQKNPRRTDTVEDPVGNKNY